MGAPIAKKAIAVPQAPGRRSPAASILYLCGGTDERRLPCRKLLFVWQPPNIGPRTIVGKIETKCRICRSFNVVELDTDPDGDA